MSMPIVVRVEEQAAQEASATFPMPIDCRDCGTPFPFSPALGRHLTPERRKACVGWMAGFSTADMFLPGGGVSDSKMSAAFEFALCPGCQEREEAA